MADTKKNPQRVSVRVENPTATCGYIDHMTVDELREQISGDDIVLACPACGLIHLSRLEIAELETKKIVDSRLYKKMKAAAEGTGNKQ